MRPQRRDFVCGQLEHEIFWKPGSVTPDLLVESLGRHTVQRREMNIEQDFMTTNKENRSFDALRRKRCSHSFGPFEKVVKCERILRDGAGFEQGILKDKGKGIRDGGVRQGGRVSILKPVPDVPIACPESYRRV